jgi:hypothetical protein
MSPSQLFRRFAAMILSHRSMTPDDIPQCTDIIASHPVLSRRYGPAIEELPRALAELLASPGPTTAIIDGRGAQAQICLIGLTALVRDDFVAELKRRPLQWFGPELTRKLARGESPLLSASEVRQANSRGGLSMLCWEACTRHGYEASGEFLRYMMSVFIETHRGYLWKEVLAPQHVSSEHLVFTLNTGGRLWDPESGGYTDQLHEDPADIFLRPHLVGATRDMDCVRWAGSWVGALFDYRAPILGLSPSEQRLAIAALQSATDERLSEMLSISLSAVKKLWISVHRRMEDRLPELISQTDTSEIPSIRRGKEKRRQLLAWLREHPEELRPFSKKLVEAQSTSALAAPLRSQVARKLVRGGVLGSRNICRY